MGWIFDPTMWAGLLTLIVLEIVLGIDNLIFIAILADKLPAKLRNKARITGLTCALFIRIILLFSLTLLVSLTNPIISIWGHLFSVRDILMLVGGLFLLFKVTMELNERLEGKYEQSGKHHHKTAKFWTVVLLIIVLDAIFSLDSVITAVGMVEHIGMMIASVTIAMILMIISSKLLTIFINTHPTIVILCLSFLLMIGFSLVAEGFGYLIPKGYLYAVIGFSIMIESFNQFALFNRRRFLKETKSLREITACAALLVLDGQHERAELDYLTSDFIYDNKEIQMIVRLLGFAKRNVSSIMTSRHDVEYFDINKPADKLLSLLEKTPHTRLVVTDESISYDPVGIIPVIDILNQQLKNQQLNLHELITQPLIFHEGLSLLRALEQFRKAHTHFSFIVDEFGSVEGIVTLTDIMETIAGNMPISQEEVHSRHDIQQLEDSCWIANGFMPLADLIFYVPIMLDEKREYETIAGLLMERLQRMPVIGEHIKIENWIFEPLEVTRHRLKKVLIIPLPCN
ncbi:Hemolysin C [Arsenophonus endosymbiont of Aleurodicus dispersus]|uniref:TerC family protein n=1 Tax=Arsenophonus endosymbiont of Aleurodicus dispersus TaxID=235559 RepID=UPI000EB0EF68|nr:TerC family protein [Arsenophonus endosymbiont of Aleurodicus dispersus]VAY02203.1 Hemolysin C [Arsenophonus endosymbiont of Aleurodicus dispersus]